MRSTLRSSITTETEDGALMAPVHPGEMLREEFMKPLGLSANALAIALRVPVTRISEIVRERRGITADTALRLARYFNVSPQFWMKLQMDYDLECAASELKDSLESEIRPRPVASDTVADEARAIA
jgi:addiction module HigA family antidote